MSNTSFIITPGGVTEGRMSGSAVTATGTPSANPTPSKPVPGETVPYTNSTDFLHAIRDPRYKTDANYRAEVERRVAAAPGRADDITVRRDTGSEAIKNAETDAPIPAAEISHEDVSAWASSLNTIGEKLGGDAAADAAILSMLTSADADGEITIPDAVAQALGGAGNVADAIAAGEELVAQQLRQLGHESGMSAASFEKYIDAIDALPNAERIKLMWSVAKGDLAAARTIAAPFTASRRAR